MITYIHDFTMNHSKKIITWFLFNFVISYMIQRSIRPYFEKKHFEKEENDKNDKKTLIDDVHNEYPEFKKLGTQFSFLKIYFALLTYYWIKVIMWVGILIVTFIQCK